MDVEIIPIGNRLTNSYLIKSKGTILVDGGFPTNQKKLEKIFKNILSDPSEIQLIIVTHGHFDHIGNLKTLVDMTDAKILIHEEDRSGLEGRVISLPPGRTLWGKIGNPIVNNIGVRFIKSELVDADIILKENEYNLQDYDIPGSVIHTPGHTEGSLSVLLETGDAIVGDLAMNTFFLCLKPRPSVFTCNSSKLRDSWDNLIMKGARMIYPGHGGSFPISEIEHEINTIQ